MSQIENLIKQFLRRPPEVSFADVVKLLEAFDYEERHSGSGSHRVFTKSGCNPITVPTIKGRRVKKKYIEMLVEILGLEEWDEIHYGA